MKEEMYRVHLMFNKKYDMEIINRLESVDNKQGYIKKLILADLGIEQAEKTHVGRPAHDLTGLRFGKWTVMKRAKELDKPGKTMWICRCDCGNERPVIGQALKNGTSKQCEYCRNKQLINKADQRKRINGKPTSTYTTWDAIRHRCYYKSQASYKDYGGRGITMCDEWKNDYFAFYDYVSKLDRFGEEGITIDRIDNEKGYEPGNVRWATRAEQNRHKRRNKK